jgi:tetratricopeptide (TPR) repeat protein
MKLVTRPVETPAVKPAEPETPVVEEPKPRTGLWNSLFGASKKQEPIQPKYGDSGVTPLPGEVSRTSAPAKPAPVIYIPPSPANFSRYTYLSPAPPAAGDRRRADESFSRAQAAERGQKWAEAQAYYRQAATLDPSWFEAQYNAAVMAQRLQNYADACAGYETALAIRPDSLDARYNFALALRAAGYVPDAVAELKKLLAIKDDDVRAHLALANIYAQILHDPAQARQYYMKVLELDPKNPRATDIRYWLVANPG